MSDQTRRENKLDVTPVVSSQLLSPCCTLVNFEIVVS